GPSSPSPAAEALLTLAAEEDAPVAELSFEEDHQRAALGTRCWALSCIDFVGPPPPRRFTTMPRGTILRVESDAARISATIGEPADEEFGPLVGAREIDLTDGRETLDLEPGRYVLELFVMWRAQGDAVMTLGIEIT
ncbi:MAG: hypothetical protein ACRDJP_14440, partial [Actinomycetota bacterium]